MNVTHGYVIFSPGRLHTYLPASVSQQPKPVSHAPNISVNYVAAKATYVYSFALWAKMGVFGPSSVKRGRTHIMLG